MNQKLWAKFTVVSILSLNGIALHYFSLPRVVNNGVLGVPTLQQILVMMTGALSSTSWLFACYLGIARPWNYTVDYSFVMFIYTGLVVSAFIVSGEVLRAMRNAKPEPPVLTDRIHLVASRKVSSE